MTDTPKPTPGWYPDPDMVDTVRYWDGNEWTEQRAPNAVPSSSASAIPSKADGPKNQRTVLVVVAAACLVIVAIGLIGLALTRGGAGSTAGVSDGSPNAEQAKKAAKQACPLVMNADRESMGQNAVDTQADPAIPLLRKAASLDPSTFRTFDDVADVITIFSSAFDDTAAGLTTGDVGTGGSTDMAIERLMTAISELKALQPTITQLCAKAQ